MRDLKLHDNHDKRISVDCLVLNVSILSVVLYSPMITAAPTPLLLRSQWPFPSAVRSGYPENLRKKNRLRSPPGQLAAVNDWDPSLICTVHCDWLTTLCSSLLDTIPAWLSTVYYTSIRLASLEYRRVSNGKVDACEFSVWKYATWWPWPTCSLFSLQSFFFSSGTSEALC